MESLAGKNALITGAGKGIGRAVAIALAKEGVHVALLARTEEQLEKTAAEVKALGVNVKVAVAVADVADINAVNAAVEKVTAELGPIDILINNAGTAKFGKFLELEPADWERNIQVNLMGVYYVTRAVLPQMIERQIGDIVNISSSAGLRGAAVTSAYSASKFGVMGLSESLMQEVRKHNIRVSALTPSTVVTDLAYDNNLIGNQPERTMQPLDIAEFIVAQLKLNRRVFIKDAGLWSTNP